MVGIDPNSDGLTRVKRLDIATTADGVQGLIGLACFVDIDIIFDATSAKAHVANAKTLEPDNKRLVDLTPAAIGSFVVPAVNLEQHSPRRTGTWLRAASGDHPSCGRGLTRHRRALRRGCRLYRFEIGRTRHPGYHR
jgi:hypothetical protein